MTTEEIIDGLIDLMLFRSVTNMPRWMEIGYSSMFWIGVSGLIYSIIKVVIK